MKFQNLISVLQPTQVVGELSKSFSALVIDSRKVNSDSVFVAIAGSKVDSHKFIPEILANKPVGIVVNKIDSNWNIGETAVVVVKDTRHALGVLASVFFENPTEKLFTVGVTGTNGKTTTAHMISEIITAIGKPCAVLGTNGNKFRNLNIQSENTTLGPLELNKTLAEFLSAGAQSVAMEVSSIGVDQHRVEGLSFDVGVFTNFTQDHLDYHGTMEAYFEAKKKFFNQVLMSSKKAKTASVINIDDPRGSDLVQVAPNPITYGFGQSDFQIVKMTPDFSGTKFSLKTSHGETGFFIPMIGQHNVYNAAAAVASAYQVSSDMDLLAKGLAKMNPVRGRLEKVNSKKPLNVFVDYAHTPDGLEKVVGFLKEMRDKISPRSQVIVVFGCGGDRDKTKRPLMLKVTEALADKIIVTSDNPRTEDPHSIIKDILVGAKDSSKIQTQVDRKQAIGLAISSAKDGDVVLIAGKGHEDYQIIGDKKTHFDDVEIAKEFLGK